MAEIRKTGYSAEEFEWLNRQSALLEIISPHSQVIATPKSAELAHRQVLSPFYDDMDTMARLLRNTVRDNREKAGILSLASDWDCIPMWAHYADNARGFVLIFDDLERIFKGDQTGVLDEVKKVKYSKEFEGMTFKPSTLENLFFWKLFDWSYEKEVRVVSEIQKCYHNKTARGTPMWLRQIDQSCISGVILGWNVDERIKEKIIRLASNSERKIDLFQAEIKGVSVTKRFLHKSIRRRD